MIRCFLSFTCHTSNPQTPSMAVRQSHWVFILGTSELHLWMKFAKSTLTAVILGDLEPVTLCENSKRLSREFMHKVCWPFTSPGSSCRSCQRFRWSSSGGRGVSLYLDDLLKGLFLWAAGLTALKFHHMLYKDWVFEAAVCLLWGLPGGTWSCCAQERLRRNWLPLFARCFQPAVLRAGHRWRLPRWLGDSGVPAWPCSSAVKRKPDTLSDVFFVCFLLIKETFKHNWLLPSSWCLWFQ